MRGKLFPDRKVIPGLDVTAEVPLSSESGHHALVIEVRGCPSNLLLFVSGSDGRFPALPLSWNVNRHPSERGRAFSPTQAVARPRAQAVTAGIVDPAVTVTGGQS